MVRAIAKRNISIYIGILLLSIAITVFALGRSLMLRDSFCCNYLFDMLSGQLERPYVYRIFMPSMINLILWITPDMVQNHIEQWLVLIMHTKVVHAIAGINHWPSVAPLIAKMP